MKQALINLGKNIKIAIMSDSTLVHYATYDFKPDSLSFMYSILKDLSIDRAVVNVPSMFSKELMCESCALDKSDLAHTSGFFCVSLTDLNKIEHLLKSVGIWKIAITENRFFPHEGNVINIFSTINALEVYAYKDGNLVDFSVQTDATLNVTLKQLCTRYGIKSIHNYVNHADLEGLPNTFNNVFVLNDKQVLADLTFMAALNEAEQFPINQYYDSELANQELISSQEDIDLDMPESESEEDFEVPEVQKKLKKEKKKNSFSPALALITIAAIAANAGIYYLSNQQKAEYTSLYTKYTQEMQTLGTLQSRYTLLSSEDTKNTGASLATILDKMKLNKNGADVTLANLLITGNTVTLEVTAKSEDALDKFTTKLQKYTEISNITDGNETEKSKNYILTLIIQ